MKILKSLIEYLIRPFRPVKIFDVSILKDMTDFDDASDAYDVKTSYAYDVEISNAIDRGRINAQKAV